MRLSRSGTRVTDNDLKNFAFAFYGVTDLHPTDRLTVSPIFRVDFVRSSLENNIINRGSDNTSAAWLPGLGLDYLLFEDKILKKILLIRL